jgi:hypothetical protein
LLLSSRRQHFGRDQLAMVSYEWMGIGDYKNRCDGRCGREILHLFFFIVVVDFFVIFDYLSYFNKVNSQTKKVNNDNKKEQSEYVTILF